MKRLICILILLLTLSAAISETTYSNIVKVDVAYPELEISTAYDGKGETPQLGDTVYFIATVHNLDNLSYVIYWQYSEDTETWYDLNYHDYVYSIVLDLDNIDDYYRYGIHIIW